MRTRCVILLVLAAAGCGKGETSSQVADAGTPETSPSHDASSDQKVPPEADLDSLPEATSDAPEGATSDKPVWQEIPGDVAGCKVQRLVNPDRIRVFSWKPCDGIAGCEIAQYDSNVIPVGGYFWGGSKVGYANDSVTAALVIYDPKIPTGAVILTNEDGRAVDGYRGDPSAKDYLTARASVWASRIAVTICSLRLDKPAICGGIIATPGGSPLLFSMPQGLWGSPGEMVLGDNYWLWNWAAPSQISSVSAVDGSGFKTPLTGSVVHGIATSGTQFFLAKDLVVDASVSEEIVVSDGAKPPQPYLTAPPGYAYGALGYAHSHVIWLRGENPQMALYDKVEVWASPYSPDPAALKPERIGDWPHNWIPGDEYSAGHGKFAAAVPVTPNQYNEVVWDVVTRTMRTFPFPADRYPAGAPGMTNTHVWVLVGDATQHTWLLRYALQ